MRPTMKTANELKYLAETRGWAVGPLTFGKIQRMGSEGGPYVGRRCIGGRDARGDSRGCYFLQSLSAVSRGLCSKPRGFNLFLAFEDPTLHSTKSCLCVRRLGFEGKALAVSRRYRTWAG